jgi:AraC-like DNA-binding protein
MHYREFSPSPPLRRVVERLWLLERGDSVAARPSADAILPDGRAEIIVHAGDPFVRVHPDGGASRQAAVLVSGQLTRAIHVAPAGVTCVAGARFRPGGLHALLGVPQHEWTDRVIPLADIDPALGRALDDDACGRSRGPDVTAALDRALCGVASRARPSSPDGVDRATALAVRHEGLVRVKHLAAGAGLGRRQLERAFRDRVGVAPKFFLRVMRFQAVLGALTTQGTDRRWAELALAHGFYDQAHFVNDFRAFTGAPPAAWEVDRQSLTALFSALGRANRDDAFFQDPAERAAAE